MYVEVQNLLKDEKLNMLSVHMCVYRYVHFKYMCLLV